MGTGPTAPQAATAPQPTATLTERGKIAADLSTLPSYEAVDQALGQPPKPLEYRVLTAGEVQCLAAAASPTAKLLVAESEAVLSGGGGILHQAAQRAAPMQSKLLCIYAIDERNKSAGMALELFYSLAEAEVRVQDVAGNPGYYTAQFWLRPHYQLEGLKGSLRLTSKLPSVKKGA
jgi:hypothetical protein